MLEFNVHKRLKWIDLTNHQLFSNFSEMKQNNKLFKNKIKLIEKERTKIEIENKKKIKIKVVEDRNE